MLLLPWGAAILLYLLAGKGIQLAARRVSSWNPDIWFSDEDVA